MKDHSHDQNKWNSLYFRCDRSLKLYCSELLNGKKLVIPFSMNKDKEHFLKSQISLQLFRTATILGRSDVMMIV